MYNHNNNIELGPLRNILQSYISLFLLVCGLSTNDKIILIIFEAD